MLQYRLWAQNKFLWAIKLFFRSEMTATKYVLVHISTVWLNIWYILARNILIVLHIIVTCACALQAGATSHKIKRFGPTPLLLLLNITFAVICNGIFFYLLLFDPPATRSATFKWALPMSACLGVFTIGFMVRTSYKDAGVIHPNLPQDSPVSSNASGKLKTREPPNTTNSLRAVPRDPPEAGIPPHDSDHTKNREHTNSDVDENNKPELTPEEEHEALTGHRLVIDNDQAPRGDEREQPRYCQVCNIDKPHRTKHCYVCNHCVTVRLQNVCPFLL